MKKVLLLLVVFVFVFAGCGTNQTPPQTSSTTPLVSTAVVAQTTPPTTSAATTTLPPTTPVVSTQTTPAYTPLTEEYAKALLAARDSGATLIALYPAGSADYLLYRLSDGRVRVDAYSGRSGELIEEDILANRGYGDGRICAYDAVDAENSGLYRLSLYVSGVAEGGLMLYPTQLQLRENDGAISLTPMMEREVLPLGFHTVAIGNDWATPELAECRVGIDRVSLGLVAPGDVAIEGNECFPLTEIAYDAETHTVVATLRNTALSADAPLFTTPGRLVESVSFTELSDGLECRIALAESVASYSCDLRTIFDPTNAGNTLGVLEIVLAQSAMDTIALLD